MLQPTLVAGDLAPVLLSPGTVCLGSGADCDVRLNVSGIAARHCLIVAGSSRTVVKALSPMTWLNDGLVRESALRCGDRLTVGPLEFQVRDAFPSELNEFERVPPTETPTGPAIDLLWQEAEARRELAEATARAEREFRVRSARRIDRPQGTASARTEPEVTESLIQQRAYLSRLADALAAREQELTAREHELTARESDLRCRRQELEAGMASIRTAEREAAAKQTACNARLAELDSERSALESARNRLNALQLEIESQQKSLEARQHDLFLQETQLEQRSAEVAERELQLRSERMRLAEELESREKGLTELAEREAALQRERIAFEAAQTVSERPAHCVEPDPIEANARHSELDALARELREQSEFLSEERSRLERLQAECSDQQCEIERGFAELQRQRSDLDLCLAELESQRAELADEQRRRDAARSGAEYEPSEPTPGSDASPAAATLQTAWDELTEARSALEAERAEFVRQLQEFALAKNRAAGQEFSASDVPAEGDIGGRGEQEYGYVSGDLQADDLNVGQQEDCSDETWAPAFADACESDAISRSEPATLPEHWESLHSELTARLEPEYAAMDADADPASAADFEQELAPLGEQPDDTRAGYEDVEAHRKPDPATSEADAVLSLRSRLAELFGIATPPSGIENVRAQTRPEPADAFESESRAVEASLVQEYEVVEEPAIAECASKSADEPTSFDAAPDADAPPSAEASEGDSITAYMERLLARSRQIAPKPSHTDHEAAPPASVPVVQAEVDSASCDIADEANVAATSPAKALSQPDKEQLRANLDSFRELANISARSAVAKHESKKLHTVVQVKLVMLAIAGGLSLALWSANLMSRGGYFSYAIAATIAAAVMAVEVVRTLLAFYRWKSVESASLVEEGEVQESPAAPLSEPPAE